MPQIVTHVGVDISKGRLDIFIHPAGTAFSEPNSEAGHAALVARCRTLEGLQVVAMEATGGYEAGLLRALRAAGLPARLIGPDQLRAYARSRRLRAKTDRLDAALIATFASAVEGRLQPAAGSDDGLDAPVKLRRQLVDMAATLRDQTGRITDPATRHCAAAALAELRRQIAQTEVLIAGRIAASPELAARAGLMRSVPGIGKVAAATLIARMPELGAISGKACAALIGVAPYDRQSGTRKARAFIQGGRSDVRQALYMCAMVAARWNPDLARFRTRLKEAGKPAKVVIVALINKLIRILNAVLERGTPFVINT